MRGTATPKGQVVLSARKPGTKHWTRVGASRADARGRWRAKVRLAPGGWELGARSRGRSAVTQAMVAGRTQKAVLRRNADKLTSGQIASVSGNPEGSQTVVLHRKDQLPKVGDVLVADASPNAPQGLLGKVVSVDPSSLTAVIEPAALSEAYSTLTVSMASTLGQMTQDDDTTSAALAGYPVKFKCRSSINSGGARPTLTARLDMSSMRASFDMDLKRKYVDLFIKGQPSLEAGLSWEAALQAGCEVRLSAPPIPLGPTGLTLDISAALEASLQSGGAVSLTGTAKARFAVGFTVSGSRVTYTRAGNLAVDWPQLTTSAQTTFELSLKDEVALMVAGRVGIFGDFGPVMDAGITLSGIESCLDVTGALQVGFGLKADLFVTDWKVDLAKAKIGLGHLYKKCVPASTPTPLPSNPVEPTPTPTPPPTPTQAQTVAATSTNTCALDAADNASCWGGSSDATGWTYAFSPVSIAGKWSAIAGRDFATMCGLDTNGHAWCGLFGGSVLTELSTRTWTSFDVGHTHGCALDASGNAWCWGLNDQGQLGTGDLTPRTEPTLVSGGHKWRQISTGGVHPSNYRNDFTCAIDVQSKAWCWGSGSTTPAEVPGGHSFTTITAGGTHTCAIDLSGKAWCWGGNDHGQLGIGDAVNTSPTPREVAGGRTWKAIAASGPTPFSGSHTCALDSAAKAWCWGSDYSGEAGDGPASQADKYAPVPVDGDHSYTTIAVSEVHTCATDASGSAWCWGADNLGQVGDGPENNEGASHAFDDPLTHRYSPAKVRSTAP